MFLTAADLEEKARKIGWPVNLPLLSRDKASMTEVTKFLRAMFTRTPEMAAEFRYDSAREAAAEKIQGPFEAGSWQPGLPW